MKGRRFPGMSRLFSLHDPLLGVKGHSLMVTGVTGWEMEGL